MKVEKGTLDFGSTTIDKDAVYLVDFSKVTSVQELILLLASVGFSFSPYHPQFENIKHMLALDNPIPTNRVQQPKEEKVELPKLKSLK